MITGLDLNATVNFTLKDDKENPTIFKLSVIPSSIYNRILTELSGTNQIYTLVQLGLRGWDNFNISFVTKKENILGKDRDVVPMDILDSLDQNHVAEIAVKIISINKVSEEERKN